MTMTIGKDHVPETATSPQLERIAAIEDPEQRARAAAKFIRDTRAKGDTHRAKRDMAAISLYVHDGWKPVQVYRLIGVSRGLFVRHTMRLEADAASRYERIPDAEHVAKAAAKRVRDYDALTAAAIEIRDEAAQQLIRMNRRSADIARITGLTTARIAQLRLGKR